MSSEQSYKTLLIEEVFLLHNITLPGKIEIFSDGVEFNYRNKVEFSWFGDKTDDDERKLWTWRFSNAAAREKLSLTEPAWHIQA